MQSIGACSEGPLLSRDGIQGGRVKNSITMLACPQLWHASVQFNSNAKAPKQYGGHSFKPFNGMPAC
jgi:hypothetical protein